MARDQPSCEWMRTMDVRTDARMDEHVCGRIQAWSAESARRENQRMKNELGVVMAARSGPYRLRMQRIVSIDRNR